MNNILVDAPPTSIYIDGQEYKIDYDFRNCLKNILAFEDPELAKVEKFSVLVELLYEDAPEDIQEAIEKGVEFLDGGMSRDENDAGVRVFSFQKDSNLIMAGFRQTYQIDLQKETELHWWTFLTLFLDIGPDTTFSNMISLRHRIKTGKATREERRMALEIGDAFELPELNNRSIEEMELEREFFSILGTGKVNDGNSN